MHRAGKAYRVLIIIREVVGTIKIGIEMFIE